MDHLREKKKTFWSPVDLFEWKEESRSKFSK